MYERFSDRARRAMQFANQESQRFNREFIGPEHILLGLSKEGNGHAGHVLTELNIGLGQIRAETEKLSEPAPDQMVMGKLPQTPRAKKVIEYAIEEAKGLNHNHVGTEHLLLGILRAGGLAVQVLNNLGASTEVVREKVLAMLAKETKAVKDKPNPDTAIVQTWHTFFADADKISICKWEYCYSQGMLEPTELNQLGAEGWELVCLRSDGQLIFKRMKQ